MNLKHRSCVLLAALALAALLAGCTAAPAPTTAVPPLATATPSLALPPSPTPLPTQAVAPTPASAAPTPLPGGESLAALREDVVLLGDGWGAGAQQVLSLGSASSVALRDGRLAYVVGRSMLLADLRGAVPQRLSDAPPAFLLGPDLVWTEDGEALLTVADREDAAAAATGRNIDIGVVTLADGTWRPGITLADCSGATILRAERARGPLFVVAWGLEPAFTKVLRYDLASGSLIAALPIAGQGEIAPSAGGRLAATTLFDTGTGLTSILVYDLTLDAAPLRAQLPLPAGSCAAGLTWSPDGRHLSYLLREGSSPTVGPGRGLGIWVWDLETGEAAKLADAEDAGAGPVIWTPDGRHVICRQVDAAGAGAYYACDIDGGSARLLPLDPTSRVLGWVK